MQTPPPRRHAFHTPLKFAVPIAAAAALCFLGDAGAEGPKTSSDPTTSTQKLPEKIPTKAASDPSRYIFCRAPFMFGSMNQGMLIRVDGRSSKAGSGGGLLEPGSARGGTANGMGPQRSSSPGAS